MRYRMKTVSELTGVPRNTLVAWERRYGVPEPERLANGYRLYSEGDVETLMRLRDALARGLSISEAIEMVRSGQPTPKPSTQEAMNDGSAYGVVRDDLAEALLAFDRPRAERVIERILNVPYLAAIEEVYFPLLRKVGDLWQTGEATVAQEHFATAFARDQLVSMLLRAGTRGAVGPRVVCATFPGEQHELGLLALAVHLSLRGCRVTYLGADVPTRDLCRLLSQTPHDCVCVSIIRATAPALVSEYARAIAEAAQPAARIVIGGAGLPAEPLKKLPKRVELVRDWRDLALD
jgi:DNA-binding transcriptional MerR regulator/methylmalonyl-CoA mutase cobalamin-binding subunit